MAFGTFLFALSIASFAHASLGSNSDVYTTNGSSVVRSNLFEGPVATALGGAGRAATSPLESSHLNPATLALLTGYYFGALYSAESEGVNSGASKYHLAVSDANEDVAFPASLTYSKVIISEEGKRDVNEQEIQIGFGKSIAPNLAIGASVKRLSEDSLNGPSLADYNGSFGFLLIPTASLGIGLVFDDVLNSPDISMNPVVGAGIQYLLLDVARLRVDWDQPQKSNPDRKGEMMVGLESLFLGEGFSLRAGEKWDQYHGRQLGSLGLGWQGPKLGIDYAYEKDLDSTDFRHLVDLSLQF